MTDGQESTVPKVTAEDLVDAASRAARSLAAADDRDWEQPAGDLDWSCRRTLDHIPDALLLYATHLSRQSTVRLPFLRNGNDQATPEELLETLVSAATILAGVARSAGPDVRAFHPAGMADPAGFLAMGCDEVLIHTHDIASGIGIAFEPPAPLCRRILARLFPWAPADADPWKALLWANGRLGLTGHERLAPDWYWHCAPLSEWDGTVKKRHQPPAW
ncbi:MAG: hypothetical protein GEU81_02920 [Nitriliruptorales bacterium]|nr:hypothetical protein [Nitriliruptorales bacterium]